MWNFIMGIYDGGGVFDIENNSCKFFCHSNDVLNSIKDFIGFDSIKLGKELIYTNINSIDVLGKMYENSKIFSLTKYELFSKHMCRSNFIGKKLI